MKGKEHTKLYILEQRGDWWRLRPEGSGRATARHRSRNLLLEQGTALGWTIVDASPDATTRDDFGRSVIEQDRDALQMSLEEENECHIEACFALAYVLGEPPPTFCSKDCRLPHLTEKGYAAINAAYDALDPLPRVPA